MTHVHKILWRPKIPTCGRPRTLDLSQRYQRWQTEKVLTFFLQIYLKLFPFRHLETSRGMLAGQSERRTSSDFRLRARKRFPHSDILVLRTRFSLGAY